MVVVMVVWCGYTLWMRGVHLPPWPEPSNLTFSKTALGWLRYTNWPYTIGLIGIFIALGPSVLAMSGEETLAQIYRDLEHPKMRILKKLSLLILAYSLFLTAAGCLIALMIIPNSTRIEHFLS